MNDETYSHSKNSNSKLNSDKSENTKMIIHHIHPMQLDLPSKNEPIFNEEFSEGLELSDIEANVYTEEQESENQDSNKKKEIYDHCSLTDFVKARKLKIKNQQKHNLKLDSNISIEIEKKIEIIPIYTR